MSEVPVAHVFFDANLALHYKRPNEIDWCALIDAREVFLIGAPILLRELEYQKVHNQSRKLRERADAFIKWLAPFARDPSAVVRPGVRWHFIPTEPILDFPAHGLSNAIADDHLIASALAYKPEPVGPIYIATADIGLEIKLRHRKISHLLLSEDTKLPVERDPQEKETQDLRRQLAQRHAPHLVLTTTSGGNYHHMAIGQPITRPSDCSLAEVQAKNPMLIKPGARPAQKNHPLADLALISAQMQSAFLPAERIDHYNEKLSVYYRDYQTYLDRLLKWEETQALTIPVSLILSNDGTIPASAIDVVLDFPDGVVLIDRNELPERPKPPEVPRKPEPLGLDAFAFHHSGRDLIELLHPRFPELVRRDYDGEPRVDREESQVSITLSMLKHGFDRNLDPFYLRFPRRNEVCSLQITYNLSAAELPHAIRGQLHFVVREGENSTNVQHNQVVFRKPAG